jgi:hypothetical protein
MRQCCADSTRSVDRQLASRTARAPAKLVEGSRIVIRRCSCRGSCRERGDDKLPPAERKARTLIFNQHEMAAFIASAKNGDFDHLLD